MPTLKVWLNTQNPAITKELSIVKSDFLHISDNPAIKEMTPWISTRQYKEEDRTIPRICGGGSLVDCIYGHSTVKFMFMQNDLHEKSKQSMTIYRIEQKEVLKPTKKLVPDAGETNELWIVPNSPETSLCKPSIIGKFFPFEIKEEYTPDGVIYSNQFYVKVIEPFILDTELLEKGFYSFKIDGFLSALNVKRQGVYEVTQITSSDWNDVYGRYVKTYTKSK